MSGTKQHESESTFGDRLKDCRRAIGMSQRELGDEAGLHHSTISKYETKSQVPSKFTALQIVDILARYKVSEELLVPLREEVNRLPGDIVDLQSVHPAIVVLNRTLGRMPSQEIDIISGGLLSWSEIEEELLKARNLNNEREWESASMRLDNFIQKLDRLTKSKYLPYYHERARTAYHRGNYQNAIQLSGMERRYIENNRELAENHLSVGLAWRRLAKWERAEREIASAEKILADDPYGLARCRRRQIGVYMLQARADEALRESEKAFEGLADDDFKGRYKLQQHKAWAFSFKGKWDQSIDLYNKASKSMHEAAADMTEEDLMLEEARESRYLADVYSLRPEWHGKAEELYKEALATLDLLRTAKKNIKLLVGMNFRGLGRIYTDQPNRSSEAQEYLDRSENVFQELQEPLGTALVYNDKGRFFCAGGQFSLAENYLLEARSGLLGVRNIYFLGDTLANLCELYYLRATTDNGRKPREKFADLSRAYQSVKDGEVRNLGRLFNIHFSKIQSYVGKACLRQEQFNKAAELLCESTNTGLSHNVYVFRERFMEVIQEIAFLTSKRELENAGSLCNVYEEFWKNQLITDPTDKRGVDHSLGEIEQKQKEIATIAGKEV